MNTLYDSDLGHEMHNTCTGWYLYNYTHHKGDDQALVAKDFEGMPNLMATELDWYLYSYWFLQLMLTWCNNDYCTAFL